MGRERFSVAVKQRLVFRVSVGCTDPSVSLS